MLDAYAGEDMPEHLATHEFFEAVKSKLTPVGVAVLNVWDEGDKERIIQKRLRATFPETACIRTSDGFNLVLFAKASGTMPERELLVKAARQFTSDLGLSFDLSKAAEELGAECGKR
jgi:spermidine synthase